MSTPSATRPRGIIIFALVLFAFSLVLLLAALVRLYPGVPLPIYLAGALYFCILGWGLLRLRRWAWYATLLGIAVLAGELIVTPLVTGQTTLAPMLVLALGAAYLCWPSVRACFLRRPEEPR